MTKRTKKHNIFFVDDDPGVRSAVAEDLEDMGCKVKCFAKAKDCLEQLPNKNCNLLITDVKMPEMDGMTLLTKVRQLQPLLPILIITGHGDVPMAVKALKTGALDFIEKPLDERVLLPAVEAALKRSANIEDLAGKPLTNSETRILQLIAEVKSNSEMAAFLHRSIRTVERHRYQLMCKLNVSSPAELTKVALALGLTSPEIN